MRICTIRSKTRALRVLSYSHVVMVAVVVIGVVVPGCQKNRAPSNPALMGPTIGRPGDTLTYAASATDPDANDVAYWFVWGDTSSVEWTSPYASGQSVTRKHVYQDSGVYRIRVKARDTLEAESGWSDSIVVAIGFLPPNTPDQPVGPSTCTTSVTAHFSTSTTDPFGDSVSFQFDWGESVGGWSPPVASGEQFTTGYAYSTPDSFQIKVRAKDKWNATSDWSSPLSVTVVEPAFEWSTVSPALVARGCAVAATANGKVYVFGGESPGPRCETEEYDPATNTWRSCTPIPRTWCIDNMAAGVVNGKIYVMGGGSGGQMTSYNYEYDPVLDEWTERASLPSARGGLVIGVVGNKIYAIGGGQNGPVPYTVNEVYDPSTNTWQTKAPMPTGRFGAACGVVNGKIYVMGEYIQQGTTANEEYDPIADVWHTRASMPSGEAYPKAGVVGDKIYVVGGWGVTNQQYDPATDRWVTMAPMPTEREAPAVSVVGDKLYVIGGQLPQSGYHYTNVNELYSRPGSVQESKIVRGHDTNSTDKASPENDGLRLLSAQR